MDTTKIKEVKVDSNTSVSDNNMYQIRDSLLICENCYDANNYPSGLKKENFETANFFNIVNPSESIYYSNV